MTRCLFQVTILISELLVIISYPDIYFLLPLRYNCESPQFLLPSYSLSLLFIACWVLSPVSEASRGVYWNQAHKNFTHPYTEYLWVSVSLWLCNSVANKSPIISAACLKTCPNSHHSQGGLEICHTNFTST